MSLLRKILVVEDDEGLADLFQHSLEHLNLPMEWLRTGQDTLALLPNEPSCLLLLDYSLPDMNAMQLVASLGARGNVPPFVVITGHGGEQVAVELMKMGALDYLIKDGHILDRLPQTVERILKDFRMREEIITLEQRSQENARELAAVYEHSPTSMLVFNGDLRLRSANPAACRLLGCEEATVGEAMGNLLECFHALNEPQGCGFTPWCAGCTLRKLLSDAMAYKKAFSQVEFELVRSTAGRLEKRYMLVSAAPLQTGERPTALLCLEDITSRKKSEEALKASEDRFRRAIVEAPIPMMMFDEQGRILQVSRGWARSSGYSLEDISSLEQWVEKALELTGDAVQQRVAQLLNVDETMPGEIWSLKTRDGLMRTWEVQTTPLGCPHVRSQMLLTMAVDVTDRRLAEAQLLRSQRMESVGRLASGIAHDLNNVLAPILLALPMLRDSVQDDRSRGLADAAETSAKRGASIIRQLLTFGRGLEGEQGPVQLKHLVREMGQIIAETFPKTIHLELHLPSEVKMIQGDVTQLHQVLMNLCINAKDAMPDGGTLALSLDEINLPAPLSGVVSRAEAGPHVRLCVRDTGLGISPENLERVFDPFFTTKDFTKGTGLGLSTVLGIVKSHHGIIRVESKEGQGSLFEILFPIMSETAVTTLEPPASRGTSTMGRGQAILVVDDEVEICRIVRRVLERKGYTVHVANNGQQALDICLQHTSEIQLGIIDYMMPKMDGVTLAIALRQILPRIPLVLSSGVGENIDEVREADMQLAQFNQRLAKPYTADVLLASVGQLLHESH